MRGPKPTCFPWLLNAIMNHNSDECLLWPFSTTGRYGQCRFGGRYESTHRLAFYLTHGHWPTPITRHTCDVARCFNPRHLLEGTAAQNSADMVLRGRSAKGTHVGNSKLTDDLVRQIRQEFKPRHGAKLARKFGVTDVTILLVAKRKIWKHLV